MARDNEGGIGRAEALEALQLQGSELEHLLQRASAARRAAFGDRVRLCAISNAKSGACAEQCDFCSQSSHFQTQAPTFPMKAARCIADEAMKAERAGASEFSIVTSGRSLRHHRELSEVAEAVRLIGEETRMERCASLGELPRDVLSRLKESGLTRYHHNIEAAPSFHPRIVHTHSYDDEVEAIQAAQDSGLKVCSGGILGMGESDEQRVEMALALRQLRPDCVPLNFLDPRPGTPLSGGHALSPMDCLRLIAMFRLVLPHTPIFVCGGREANLQHLQHRIFEAGASGTMVGDYLTTRGQQAAVDRAMILDAGLQIEAPR